MATLWFFQHLGLAEETDQRSIKRAYAARLKQLDQVSDAEAFGRLRRAYEMALDECSRRQGVHLMEAPHAATAADDPSTQHADEIGTSTPAAHPGRTPHETLHALAGNEAEIQPPQTCPPEPGPASHEQSVTAAALASPVDIVRHNVQQLAGLLVEGQPAPQALGSVCRELQQGHVQLMIMFEVALIDAIAQARLPAPIMVFHAARALFAWNDVAHLRALGPRGQWIGAVIAEEAAWLGQRSEWEGAQWFEYLERTPSTQGITTTLAGQWPRVVQQLHRFPAFLRLKIDPAVLEAWSRAFAALPALDRNLADTYAQMPSPAAFRKAVPRARTRSGPTLGIVLAIFFGIRMISAMIDSSTPSRDNAYTATTEQAAELVSRNSSEPVNPQTCKRLERRIHASDWVPPAKPIERRRLGEFAHDCLRRNEWPDGREADPRLAALGVSS